MSRFSPKPFQPPVPQTFRVGQTPDPKDRRQLRSPGASRWLYTKMTQQGIMIITWGGGKLFLLENSKWSVQRKAGGRTWGEMLTCCLSAASSAPRTPLPDASPQRSTSPHWVCSRMRMNLSAVLNSQALFSPGSALIHHLLNT